MWTGPICGQYSGGKVCDTSSVKIIETGTVGTWSLFDRQLKQLPWILQAADVLQNDI